MRIVNGTLNLEVLYVHIIVGIYPILDLESKALPEIAYARRIWPQIFVKV